MDKATYIQTINIMGNDVFIYKTRFPGTDIYEAVMPCFRHVNYVCSKKERPPTQLEGRMGGRIKVVYLNL